MTDTGTRCPWCSALLPEPVPPHCPSCQAALGGAGAADPVVPGVTSIDAAAVLRGASAAPKQRGRLLSFLTGDVAETEVSPEESASLAPPDDAVRREMLRLELEAERAEVMAEVVARKSEALAEQGIHISQLGGEPAFTEPTLEPDPDAAAKGPTKG